MRNQEPKNHLIIMKCVKKLKAGSILCSLLAFTPNLWSQANPAKLLTYWDFNESSDPASAKDKLHSVPGVILGGAAYTADAAGRSGQGGDRAMDFGTTGTKSVRVRGGAFTKLLNTVGAADQITVAFWQKLHNVASSSSFWMMSPSSTADQRGYQAHVPWSDQTIYFDSAGCCAGNQRINAPISTLPAFDPDGDGTPNWAWTNWHHFAFVKDGAIKQIWVDGVLFHSGEGADPFPTDITEMFIGAGAGGGSTVRGMLDDFAVFLSPLDESQLTRLATGSSPAALVVDTDSDGMPDWWEDLNTLNKGSNDAAQDADADGVSNLAEYQKLSDPKNADSDGDGLKDGVESGTGTYVSATDTGTDPQSADTDADGLKDGVETNSGTFVNATNSGSNPTKADTDGDGFNDGLEVKFGGNPVDADKKPLPTGTAKLIAWWDFNNSTDPAKTVDRVNALQGEVRGAAAFVPGHTTQATDQALYFTAPGDTVLVEDGSFMNIPGRLDQITISFWQKNDDTANSSSFWAVSPSSVDTQRGVQAHVPWSDQTIYFDTGGAAGGSTRLNRNISQLPGSDPNTPFDWTQWHHYALVKNGTTKQIYVDGKLLISGANTAALKTDFIRLWIGSQQNGAAPVHGVIDDFAVFASALDKNRILDLALGAAPNNIEQILDTDSDGMPDSFELSNNLNRIVNDANLDPDNDGSSNLQEFQRGTSPQVADTDGDGLKDGVETGTGVYVSVTNTGTDPINADTDRDGLSDGIENSSGTFVSAENPGTNPLKIDTDADGIGDGKEIALNSNPVDPKSTPAGYKPGEPNLIAYWDFNTATDPEKTLDRVASIEGQVLNGAIFTEDAQGRTARPGDRGMDLGPADAAGTEFVNVPDVSFLNLAGALDQMTVSVWQNLTAVADSSIVWMTGADQDRAFQAHTPWSDHTVYFDTGGGCCGAETQRINRSLRQRTGYTDSFLIGSWHHFVFSKSGPVKQIWIDGELFLQANSVNALTTEFTGLAIGSAPNGSSSLRGKIDDFAIFATALTEGQVKAIFNGTSPLELKGGVTPTITLARNSGGVMSITYAGTLESSETMSSGSWTAVQGATSPFTIVNPAAKRFYRAKQ
jgi:hypothetical protein